GAGAFVMVELTRVPYTQIMAAAFLPAVLYFFAVWIGINAYARHHDLAGIADEDRPTAKSVVITSAFFLVPFLVLLYGMFIAGYTPQYAACMAIITGFVMLFFNAKGTFDKRQILLRLESAFLNAARQVSVIASIIICASIIIGVLSITGLGVKITSLILSGSGGLLWPSLLLTALACLILGMEVPTTAAYVICVSVAGPALVQLGLEPLQAHLFVFWFALLSTITPPVCGAVFIAAGMIGENWLKVAMTAMALGVGLYIIPLAMIANPAMIALSNTPMVAFLATVKTGIGLALISYGLIGYSKPAPKVVAITVGLLAVFVKVDAF
ncbi:MAG: TRAP transporter large permease subunit, partial [Pseudomonadota bacterium]